MVISQITEIGLHFPSNNCWFVVSRQQLVCTVMFFVRQQTIVGEILTCWLFFHREKVTSILILCRRFENSKYILWLKLSVNSNRKFNLKLLLKNVKKSSDMNWALYIISIMPQIWKNCLNMAKQRTFRTFRNSERNLVMHFHKPVYRHISQFH